MLQYGIHTLLRTSTPSKASSDVLPDLLSRISRFTSVSSLLKDLNWAPLKDRRRDIRLAMLFKIVKCNMPVQADEILLPADPRTRHHHSFKFKHIQSHTTQYKHCFLSGQYLSGTLFLKPVSTRIPSPHSRRSTITRPERCAHHPSS